MKMRYIILASLLLIAGLGCKKSPDIANTDTGGGTTVIANGKALPTGAVDGVEIKADEVVELSNRL